MARTYINLGFLLALCGIDVDVEVGIFEHEACETVLRVLRLMLHLDVSRGISLLRTSEDECPLVDCSGVERDE